MAMQVRINPEMEDFITMKLKNGSFSSVEEVVHTALTVLKHREMFGDFEPGELEALVAEGEESIARFGTIDGDEALQQRRARRANRSGTDE